VRELALILLAATAAAVTYFYGDFVKLRAGPLYALELAWLAWFAAAALAGRSWPIGRRGGWWKLWPAALFFAWGLALLGADLAFRRDQISDARTAMRFVQHALIFVYPLLWMVAGFWLAKASRRWASIAAYATLAAAAAPHLWGRWTINHSVGPLLAVALVAAMMARRWLVAAALAALTFVPFWKMWADHYIQRTTLLLLLFMLVAAPWILRRKGRRSFLQAAGAMAAALAVLVAGALVISATRAAVPAQQLVAGLQHGDDSPNHPDDFPIQGRMRRVWWKDTFEFWRTSPITGVGFIPEIPRLAEENTPNTWENVLAHPRIRSTAPIAGPHNSYLNILARMGLVGFTLFTLLTAVWLRHAWQFARRPGLGLADALILLIPVNGAIHALVNVGLEAPQNCMVMWLFAGVVTGSTLGTTSRSVPRRPRFASSARSR
jgi:O-antigen ligase